MSAWLVQTDCASTTSTSGSIMATRRMVLMSNPYTRSHPEQGEERGGAHESGEMWSGMEWGHSRDSSGECALLQPSQWIFSSL